MVSVVPLAVVVLVAVLFFQAGHYWGLEVSDDLFTKPHH